MSQHAVVCPGCASTIPVDEKAGDAPIDHLKQRALEEHYIKYHNINADESNTY